MKHKNVTNALIEHFRSEQKIINVSKNLQKGNQVIFCNSADVCSVVVSCLAQKSPNSLIVVVDLPRDVHRLGALCRDLFGGDVFLLYKESSGETNVPGFGSDYNYEFERSCYSLINNHPGLYITDKKTLSRSFNTKGGELNKEIKIKIGQELVQKEIITMLGDWGYVGTDHCVGSRTFAVRGGILDVFPPHLKDPIRIEFYDNRVESIRLFDVDSQLSISKREHFFIPKPVSLVDSGGDSTVLDIFKNAGNLLYITQEKKGGNLSQDLEIYVETFRALSFKDKISTAVVSEAAKNNKIVFTVNAENTDLVGLEKATHIAGPFLKSFSIPLFSLSCLVFGPGRPSSRSEDKRLPINVSSKKILGLSEISWGDYLVHQDFGVGRYRGLQTILVGGAKRREH